MAFCLIRSDVRKFIAALKDGTINPEKMIDMSSEERRAFFADIIGETNAKEVNALLESKLLLKDQQRGMMAWAKQVSGIAEPARADMISRIGRMDKVLDATDEHSFLADLAAKKLGTEVTFKEAKAIADLSKRLSDTRDAIKPDDPIGSPSRLAYGAAHVAMQNLVHELKLTNNKATLSIRSMGDAVVALPGIAKSFKASFDDSYAGRQGFRAIFTNPVLWGKNFLNTFGYMARSLAHKGTDSRVLDAIKADIYSRPNALNGNYRNLKLDVGIDHEEAYPTSALAHIPLLGRLFKASENAYSGMAMRLRADIGDKMIAMAEANDVNLSDKSEAESIGRLVNSLTGRGNLGQLEKVGKLVNVWFFSPKFLKSQFDFLTGHTFDKPSKFVRKQAAINLLKVTAGIATIMGIANALWPGSVELDPRSANFGKIKIGNTRFDITGGMGSLVTLAVRLGRMETKSSTTNKVTPLNSDKYGAQTGLDVAVTFATNKTSPAGSVLVDMLRGQTFGGGKPTVGGELYNMFTPFPISNTQQLLADPKAANAVLGELADFFGIAVNDYGPVKKR